MAYGFEHTMVLHRVGLAIGSDGICHIRFRDIILDSKMVLSMALSSWISLWVLL
jgi:hypothetical protein